MLCDFEVEERITHTEGSTHCIKAMLCNLAMQRKRSSADHIFWQQMYIEMIDACALLDLDIHFMKHQSNSLCTCVISAEILKDALAKKDLTSRWLYM